MSPIRTVGALIGSATSSVAYVAVFTGAAAIGAAVLGVPVLAGAAVGLTFAGVFSVVNTVGQTIFHAIMAAAKIQNKSVLSLGSLSIAILSGVAGGGAAAALVATGVLGITAAAGFSVLLTAALISTVISIAIIFAVGLAVLAGGACLYGIYRVTR